MSLESPRHQRRPPIASVKSSSFSGQRTMDDQQSVSSRRSLCQSMLFKPCSLFSEGDESPDAQPDDDLMDPPLHAEQDDSNHHLHTPGSVASYNPLVGPAAHASERKILAERPRAIAASEHSQTLSHPRSNSIATSSVTASRTSSAASATPSNHACVPSSTIVPLATQRRRRSKQRTNRCSISEGKTPSRATDAVSIVSLEDLPTEEADSDSDEDDRTSLPKLASPATEMPVVPGFDRSDSDDDFPIASPLDPESPVPVSLPAYPYRSLSASLSNLVRRVPSQERHFRRSECLADSTSSIGRRRGLKRVGTSDDLPSAEESPGELPFLKRISGRITSGRLSGKLIPVRRQSTDARYYSESYLRRPREQLRAAVGNDLTVHHRGVSEESGNNSPLLKMWHNAIRCEIKDISLALATATTAKKKFTRKDDLAFVIWWKQFEDFTTFIFHLQETYIFETLKENLTVKQILSPKTRSASYQRIREQMKAVEACSLVTNADKVEGAIKECTDIIVSHMFLVEATFPRILDCSTQDVHSIETFMMAGLKADSVMEQIAVPLILRAVTNPRRREQLLQSTYPGLPNRLRIRYWQKRLAKEHTRHMVTLAG